MRERENILKNSETIVPIKKNKMPTEKNLQP